MARKRWAPVRKSWERTKLAEIPALFRPGFCRVMDGRTKIARAVAYWVNALEDALGGPTMLSPQQLILCQRAAFLHFKLGEIEAAYATKETLDTDTYAALTRALVSVMRTLGVRRIPRDVESLEQYLESQVEHTEEAASAE